jgi:hypothetical protein
MSDRKEEVNALWEEYQKVFYVYWNARGKAVEKAIASVSDLKAASDEAHAAYCASRPNTRTPSEEIAQAIVAPLEELAMLFPWPSFRAVGRRILGRKK